MAKKKHPLEEVFGVPEPSPGAYDAMAKTFTEGYSVHGPHGSLYLVDLHDLEDKEFLAAVIDYMDGRLPAERANWYFSGAYERERDKGTLDSK